MLAAIPGFVWGLSIWSSFLCGNTFQLLHFIDLQQKSIQKTSILSAETLQVRPEDRDDGCLPPLLPLRLPL